MITTLEQFVADAFTEHPEQREAVVRLLEAKRKRIEEDLANVRRQREINRCYASWDEIRVQMWTDLIYHKCY